MIDFQSTTENGPFTIIKWKNTIGLPIVYVTENIENLTGYSSDSFISENINYFDLIDKHYLHHIDKQLRSAELKVLDKFQFKKYYIKTKENNIVWVEHYVTVSRNNTGEIDSYTGYLLNISDRIETEQKLEVSKNETRALINALPDTILQITNKGELKRYLLQNTENNNNYKTDVFLSDVFPPDFASKVPDYLDKVIHNKTLDIYEYRTSSENKKPCYYEARFSAKSQNDAIIIIRDITERKENEKFMTDAIKAVEKANKEKSKFLSNMSHELRTPLNAIMGFAQIIMLKNGKQAKDAEEIYNAGQHLLSLINDLLDISKIEAGKINLSIEPVTLKSIIRDCETIFNPLIKETNIHFNRPEIIPNISLSVDRTRIIQVLINLLSNAFKYNTENGSITIQFEASNNILTIKIIDTGIGMSKNQIQKLFKPFERVGAETTNIEGTGLGLALSKTLIELMNGKIGVESTPGKGSVFWVSLEITREIQNNTNISKPSKTDIPKKIEQSLQILYIEDNLQNQQLIHTLISGNTAHELILANTGKDGITQAAELQPDVIFLDINLPDISGYQVMEELNKSLITQNIPVYAISANATKADIEKASAAGFIEYLTKPIDVTKLLKLINSLSN